MNAQNLCRNPLKEGNTWVCLPYIQLTKYLEWRDIRTYQDRLCLWETGWRQYASSNRYKLDISISSKGKLLLSALRLPEHLPPLADINALISTSTLPDTFTVWCFSTEQLYVHQCSYTKAYVQLKDVSRYCSKLLKTFWITTTVIFQLVLMVHIASMCKLHQNVKLTMQAEVVNGWRK